MHRILTLVVLFSVPASAEVKTWDTLRRSGDTMRGHLQMNSTATIMGDAFSVGGTTLTIVGGRVGVGRTPGDPFPPFFSGFSLDVASGVRVSATSPNFAAFTAFQYGQTSLFSGGVSIRNARGTEAARTATQAGDSLGFFTMRGYDGTVYSTGARAGFIGFADAPFTSGNQPAFLSLFVATAGAVSFINAVRIDSKANVTIGQSFNTPGVFAGATLQVKKQPWDTFAVKVSSENGTDLLAVTAEGKVGLGTTTPTEILHVVGNSSVTGTGFYGSTLTAKDSLAVGTFIDITTSPDAPAHREGRLFWDRGDRTLGLYNEEPDVTLQIGQESWIRVRNNTGSTILSGKPVYINGALGNRPTIALAKGDSDNTSMVAGVTTHDIENNTDGYVTTMGLVRGLDTSAFSEGDDLHLSTTTAGGYQVNHLVGPGFDVQIGRVVKSNPGSGIIFVKPQLHQTVGIGAGDQVRAMNATGIMEVFKAMSGTANRVTVTHSDTAITLNAPQDLHSGASPTFAGMTVNGNFVGSDSVTASGFFGNGAGLTGVSGTDSTKVAKAGDTMTGSLNFSGVASDLTSANNENIAIMPNGTGKVGVGTASPVTKLQVGVGNTSADTAIAKFNTADTDVAALELSNWDGASTSFGPRIHFDNSGVGTWYIGSSNGANNFDIAAAWGTPLLRVTSGGNVAIRTTGSKLIMTSPDGTCSSCGPDNADVWSCTSVACP